MIGDCWIYQPFFKKKINKNKKKLIKIKIKLKKINTKYGHVIVGY